MNNCKYKCMAVFLVFPSTAISASSSPLGIGLIGILIYLLSFLILVVYAGKYLFSTISGIIKYVNIKMHTE